MPKSSVVASWELALRLRRRRIEKIDIPTLTRKMGFTRNYWSAVENDRKVLSEESLAKIFELLEFDHEERQELLELRETAKRREWWTQYTGLLSAEIQRLYGLEYGATSMRTYENLLMPGLLQTADYARAIMTADVTVRQVDIEELIKIRLQRQERLTDADPLVLTAVISQAALMQEIGGALVLRRQLEHLARIAEEHAGTIFLRVVPFTAISCPLIGSATTHVIDFASPKLPSLAWQETVTTYGVIDDPVQVRDIDTAYSETLAIALSPQESLEMIHSRIEEKA
jgi:transcriptional regulator with XRE-family HTH domain